MINRLPLLMLMLPVLLAGCITIHRPGDNAPPDLDGIILGEISWHSNTVQEVLADIGRQCARKYPDARLGFELRPAGDVDNYDPKISLRAKDISLSDALRLICMTTGLTYWTEGSAVVVGTGAPEFQVPILRHDPAASNLLTQALCHLFTAPDANRDLSCYLFDPSRDEKPPLRRLLLNAGTFPKHFTFAIPKVSTILTNDLSRPEIGDLTVSVHRYQDRGARMKIIVFFITGPNVMGGGWFFYYATRRDDKWKLEYCGCYDP